MNHITSGMSRRDFVRAGAVGLAGLSMTTAFLTHAAAGKKIPVGLQLYSLREQCKTDLPGMLAAVSRIGYKGVEFAGYHGRSAAELKKMLADNGLVCCGTHTPLETIQPAKLEETIEFNRTIGNKYLIVPWMTGKTRQEWLDKARLFNEVAEKVKAAGMVVGYHAHAHDFHKLEGERAWDIFFGNTKPEVVMQLDTSNCLEGGADPVAVLKQYARRATTIHLKANGAGPEAVIGEDKVDWKAVFDICEAQGVTEWYIVEHESSKDPLDAVKRSFEALKKMGKV
ncbi:MAG TPA: sugar phosphate isomerase/epimerase [Candidatus Paceibacterota bacterium]|nr:sugar phosphate isomerase/epimerase [Candidatus Paceibacterota bacterium]